LGSQFEGNAIAGKETIDRSDKLSESGIAIKIEMVVSEIRVKVPLDWLSDRPRTEFEEIKDDQKVGHFIRDPEFLLAPSDRDARGIPA